jgi:hypothetical protein
MITKEKAVVCLLHSPVPIAYLNVYEDGDVWIKTNNCDNCPPESMKRCCGHCPMVAKIGCYWHLEDKKRSSKPYSCVVFPTPSDCYSFCQLEFKCITGSNVGKVRKVSEAGNIFS